MSFPLWQCFLSIIVSLIRRLNLYVTLNSFVMTISSTSQSPISSSQNGEQLSKARRYWRLFYTNISVEPLLFLYGLGFSISQSISPVLYMDKICLVGSPLFGNASQTWDKEICDHMDTGQYPHVQTYVQTVSTKS